MDEEMVNAMCFSSDVEGIPEEEMDVTAGNPENLDDFEDGE